MTMRYLITTILLIGALSGATAQDAPKTNTPKKAAPKKNPAADAARLEAQRKAYLASFQPGRVRIKDIAHIQGVRGNQLIGYGLVVGLEGTGDGQLAVFTPQSLLNTLRNFGITVNISPSQLQVKNVAAVLVTAELPPFVREGSTIDVNVSSIGDAKSLQGGTLLQTPLRAGNGQVYAVAQGALSIGGFNFSSGGSSVQKNHVAAGRVPRGAKVEQDVPVTIMENGRVQITLHEPDFTTATRIAAAIRAEMRGVQAQASDPGAVTVLVPPEQASDLVPFLAQLEVLSVTPDALAKIVINERTGTVAVGGNVRLLPGAVTQGAISVRIENTPVVVPPAPFNPNPGQVVPLQNTTAEERMMRVAPIPSTTTIDQLVRALNNLGVTPRDLIAILQSMRAAGMIAGEIEVQ